MSPVLSYLRGQATRPRPGPCPDCATKDRTIERLTRQLTETRQWLREEAAAHDTHHREDDQ